MEVSNKQQHNQRVHGRGSLESVSRGDGRIRAELNIEKWPALWRPSHSPNAATARILEREHSLPNGSRIRARVEVGFSNLGELTTEDQKTYYALVKLWETNGRSPEHTFFSIRGLARVLRKRWGTNVITAITASLRRLRATPITWENAYFAGDRRETIEEIDTFNILSDLKIVRRKVDGVVTKEAGYFRFNDFSLRNLFSNHTKPVLFETILSFRTDVAQLLYGHLDLIMADKRGYQRRTRELFVDLGLRGTEYNRLYERKRALSKALGELRGAPLTTGSIAEIHVERTQDRKDYKLVVSKGANPAKNSAVRRVEQSGGVARPPRAALPNPLAPQAEDLVRYFHRRFHNVEQTRPQSKEMSHATALIAQFGRERAAHIIDFAHLAAPKTGYLPQTFGGIMQYSSRALADYEYSLRTKEESVKARKQAETRRAFETLEAEAYKKKRRMAEDRLKTLSEGEYQALLEGAKAQVLKHSTWLRPDNAATMFENLVRARMIANLMPLDVDDAQAISGRQP